MTSIILVFATLLFSNSKTLQTQICLDRAGYSCSAIDGQWGARSQAALCAYCEDFGLKLPNSPEEAYDKLFPSAAGIFTETILKEEDFSSLTPIPKSPSERAELSSMGYENMRELLAERGHLTARALERLNPNVDWDRLKPGDKILIPRFASIEEELSAWPRTNPKAPKRPTAAKLEISLSDFRITVYDKSGKRIALFPCSIAKNKAKLPSGGELKITTVIANPNYTYTPEDKKASRYVWPPGPRNPVGVAWIGLNLPGYGIHGTPKPETIGRPESHGCFRLTNWNAARLYAMCKVGTIIIIKP
ncbi:MAG: L,D-transpeptidase [Kiritimatiellae bacterium]|nr:L,D-transpeptidase [Kiritimatiellia bacterium]